jgi:hypothetical protein
MCLRTKSLVFSVPRTMSLFNDASLGRRVPDRCVLTLDRIEVFVVTSRGRVIQGTHRLRGASSKGRYIRDF